MHYVFSNENNILIYVYADIILNESNFHTSLNLNSKITFSSNGLYKISLNFSNYQHLNLVFRNILIFNNENVLKVNSINLENSTFVDSPPRSIISRSFISDSKSLKSISSVYTDKFEITSNLLNLKQTDIFITKSSTDYLFSKDNPQVLIYNSVSCELIFGTNYIQFNNYKIISSIKSFIEIESTAPIINASCHSSLIPNVLLTPSIHMISGKINFFGSQWPRLPKKIDSYWENGNFYEENDREFIVLLEKESSVYLYGDKIPISIKSNNILSIYCHSAQCGIAGQIYVKSPKDFVYSDLNEKVTFSVSYIENSTADGVLHTQNSGIHVIIGTCRSSSVISGLQSYECKSIDNDRDEITSSINLSENGPIKYHMKLNTKSVINQLKSLISFKTIPNIFNDNGDLNMSAIIEYIVNSFSTGDMNSLSIISALKTFGNNIGNIDFVKTNGVHDLLIERKDVMFSLFYSNLYQYNKYLVCSNDQFKMNEWRIKFSEYSPNHNSIPFFDFHESNLNFTAKNYINNEVSYCLQMKINQFPDSAIEFLIYTCNPKLEGKFTWASNCFFTFVFWKKLSDIKSIMGNPNAKNIVFLALDDLKSELNLNGIREDANVLFIGASSKIFENLTNITDFTDFEMSKPKIDVSYSRLNSIGYVFCQINEKKVNVNNFASFASDILNNEDFELNANEVAFDLSTWKQLENNTHEFHFKNFVFCPFQLKPSLLYKGIQKVDFLKDKWKILFENSSDFVEFNYSMISDRFLMMTETDSALTLRLDNSAIFSIRPLEIGYTIGIDRQLSKFPVVPLMSAENNRFVSHSLDRVSFSNILLSAIHMVKKENIQTPKDTVKIVFEGSWNQVKEFKNNLVYSSEKKKLIVSNYPANLAHKIDLSAKERIDFESFIQNDSSKSSQIELRRSFPLLINGQYAYSIPDYVGIDFDNITVIKAGSSFNLISRNTLSECTVRTKYFKSSVGSSSIFNRISITDTVDLEPNTYTIFETPTFSKSVKINYFYSLDKRYPVLIIKSEKVDINSISLHYVSDKALSNDEIVNEHALKSQIIFKVQSSQNECRNVLKYFDFVSENDNRFAGLNNFLWLFCDFAVIDGINYTCVGLNFTVEVVEGDAALGKSNKMSGAIIAVVVVSVVLVVAALVIVFILVLLLKRKKKICQGADEPLNSSKNISEESLSDDTNSQ